MAATPGAEALTSTVGTTPIGIVFNSVEIGVVKVLETKTTELLSTIHF